MEVYLLKFNALIFIIYLFAVILCILNWNQTFPFKAIFLLCPPKMWAQTIFMETPWSKVCRRISGKYSFSPVKILWLRIWHWPHSTRGAWPDVWLGITLSSTLVAHYRIPMEGSSFTLESLKSPQLGYFDICCRWHSMTLWISQESFCVLKLSLVGSDSCDNYNRYFLTETFSVWSSITPSTMTLAVALFASFMNFCLINISK